MIARTPGLIAHVIEEQTREKPMRRIDPVNHGYDGTPGEESVKVIGHTISSCAAYDILVDFPAKHLPAGYDLALDGWYRIGQSRQRRTRLQRIQ
jgi:hypothetical protein